MHGRLQLLAQDWLMENLAWDLRVVPLVYCQGIAGQHEYRYVHFEFPIKDPRNVMACFAIA